MVMANEYRPSKWEDFKGTNIGVDYLKSCIRTNNHPSAALITGLPGCGKSTLAQLYTRSTLCPNRKVGEADGCGRCSICMGEDTTNITYYLVKDSSGAKENVERLVDTSYTKPVVIEGVREDQYRRFVVVDEAELIHPTTISALLNPLEYPPSTTTWILISMDSHKLPLITREAIESRSKEIRLRSIDKETIEGLLIDKTGVDKEVASLIARFSNSNVRRAWSLLEMMRGMEVEAIRNHFLGTATPSNRQDMWQSLSKGEVTKVRAIVSSWENSIEPNNLCSLLLEDLIEMDTTPIELLKSLEAWNRSNTKYPLLAALLPYRDFYIDIPITPIPIQPPPKAVIPIGEIGKDFSKNVMDLISSKSTNTNKVESTSYKHPLTYSNLSEWIDTYAVD
jgi:DNA polymerase III gamma/tau subunit